MRRFLASLTLTASFVLLFNVGAQADPFATGVQALRENRAPEALESLRAALDQNPGDPALLTNLGIAAHKAGQNGWAMAYLREARVLGSSLLETTQALDFVESQLPVKELPRSSSTWESLRDPLLVGISLPALLIFHAILIWLLGQEVLRFVRDYRRASQAEGAWPTWGLYPTLAAAGFVLCTLLVILKTQDQSQVRGTVVTPGALPVKSAPQSDAPSLFDLHEGLEVVIIRKQGDWLQVRYPGGAAGWVEQKTVHITQSRQLLEL